MIEICFRCHWSGCRREFTLYAAAQGPVYRVHSDRAMIHVDRVIVHYWPLSIE